MAKGADVAVVALNEDLEIFIALLPRILASKSKLYIDVFTSMVVVTRMKILKHTNTRTRMNSFCPKDILMISIVHIAILV